ncbi:conserved hypothetical protein [Thermobaculum terrenum ATCC BAA-798]|uniref:Twin-arginine translocation pathway signal n=1 Tax=Thermobaculum terrenum (strain ATCC BAA-798 / CCMEE 7001 / YNP1) TaxID=525904 RepID=D1CIN3_THET1|nr:ferritin-like domain-containing protein [Thermobaculum terrenum]ACZ43604.1 conserved hypothetical protein [Thermobaculum terrenum ATCC BAA-798]
MGNMETERRGFSRRDFLKTSGAVAAGLVAVMAAGGSPIANGRAYAMNLLQGASDLDILNFALTLEHLEATFYKWVVSGKYARLSGDSLVVATAVRDHEIAHVDFLTKAIKAAGGKPVGPLSNYKFEAVGDTSSAAGILKIAETLEGVGVGAYTGAAHLIKNADYLFAAAQIEQVEARHHGAFRWFNDTNPAGGYQDFLGPSYDVPTVKKQIAPIIS